MILLFVLPFLLFDCSMAPARTGSVSSPDLSKDKAYGRYIGALFYAMSGDMASAEKGYREVLRTDSSATYVRFLLANLLFGAGEAEQALPFIEQAVREESLSCDYRSLQGAVLFYSLK